MASTFSYSSNAYSVEKNTTGYSDISKEARVVIILKYIGKDKKVLDVGCYNGEITKIISDKGNEVFGLDASETGIAEFNSRGIHGRGFVGDLEGIFPFEDETFDIVHAGEIIEHLYDTDQFIRECKRVLKKGGEIIITTPNVVSLPRRILYLFGYGRFFEASNSFSAEGSFAVGHIRFFDKALLLNFMRYHGFISMEFTSDYVNFPFFQSKLLAKIKPTFGRTLIAMFKK